jgi:hypothetical protein
MVASSYPFLDIVGTMFIFLLLAAWFWLLIRVFADVFRRQDLSGWGKAGWLLFTIAFPWLGAFVYVISQNKGMADRDLEREEAARARFAGQVRAASHNGSTADEIERAKRLLDTGAIDYNEFEELKQKALG